MRACKVRPLNPWERTRKYRSFFRIRFQGGMQYRAAALGGIFTQFFWGFMQIMIYLAFNRSAAPGAFPMEMQALSSYLWLQEALLVLFTPWANDGELLDMISSGSVAYELCRPLDLYSLWLSRELSARLSRLTLRCLPILLVAFLLPAPFGCSLPPDPSTFAAFLLSALLGYLVASSFAMLVYTSCFFTVSPAGIRICCATVAEFLSGAIIPLPFLPDGLRGVVELLPFASMQNMPLRIYSGDIAGAGTAWGILLQTIWLAIFALSGRAPMKKALVRTVVQGG